VIERRFAVAVAVLGVAFAMTLALGIKTYVAQQDANARIVALANAHHADSTRIEAAQRALIDEVDRLSCERTIVTRSALVTFFDQAASERLAAERSELDPRAAALDAALVRADRLAAKQERSAGCDGAFPDGGSG
jgi:hypothetical protein